MACAPGVVAIMLAFARYQASWFQHSLAQSEASHKEWLAKAEAGRKEWQNKLEADRKEWQVKLESDGREWQSRLEADRKEWQAKFEADAKERQAQFEAANKAFLHEMDKRYSDRFGDIYHRIDKLEAQTEPGK